MSAKIADLGDTRGEEEEEEHATRCRLDESSEVIECYSNRRTSRNGRKTSHMFISVYLAECAAAAAASNHSQRLLIFAALPLG